MDFTFDNPFEDVFTDPNAVAPQAAPVVQQPAPVQPQPVANAQPYAQPAHQPQPGYGQPNNVGGGPNPAYQQPGGNAAQPGAQTTPATQPQFQPTPTGYGNPAMQQNTAPGGYQQANQAQGNYSAGAGANPATSAPQQPQQSPPVVAQPVQPAQTAQPAVQPAAQPQATQPAATTAAPAAEAVPANPNDIWREAKAPNGRIYYYKKSTRETTWTKPGTYIPLGGTTPVSSAPAATPAPAAITPVSTNPAPATTNAPLTGFQLTGLNNVPAATGPASASQASPSSSSVHDNPALSGGASAGGNPALQGPSNPALNSSNPAVGSNPPLNSSNPAVASPYGQPASSQPQTAHQQQPQQGGGYGQQPAQQPAQQPQNDLSAFSFDATPSTTEAQSPFSTPQQDPHSTPQQTPYAAPEQQQGSYDPMTGQWVPTGGYDAQQSPFGQPQEQAQVMYDEYGNPMYDANGQLMYHQNNQTAAYGQGGQYDQYGQPQQPQGEYNQNAGYGANTGAVTAATPGHVPAATAAAAPSAATPTHKHLKVRLPHDQRQVVPFKADVTLRSVLSKICLARGISVDDYLAKDRSGQDIMLDLTLGEINQDEISFLTPRAGVVPQDETKRKAHKFMSDIYEANAGLSSSLQAIIKNYRDPLLKSAQEVDMRKRLLTEQECNQIFASIESITSMTKDFMAHLSKQLSIWPVDLTDMITRQSEVLPFYNDFVNNYRSNMNKLEELRRNPDFTAFVDGVQRSLGTKLRLEDFFALPALKISATATLLDQLITVLTDQHPNFFTLRDFHQRLQPIANQAMALRLQMEARSKIVHLENTVAKFPQKKGALLHDSRLFFRDGMFEITLKKKATLCYVALFTDLLVVCKAAEKKKKEKAPSPPTFEEVIAFGPTGCTVEEAGTQGWNLQLDTPGKGKSTINCMIHTSSEYQKADWVKSFREAFQDFSTKPHLKPPVL